MMLVSSILLGAPPISHARNVSSENVKKHWTSDNGNGTYSNPLFYEEFEDPDVIRVGTDYYLAGTTMHMNPAVILMHSKDLVNWSLAGYCSPRLDLGSEYRLEGGNIYGQGIWAPCLRYHKGTFYVFCNVNRAGLLVYSSPSIRGPWKRHQLPGRHDQSVLFDDELGKIFMISGGSSPYPIEELTPDLKSFIPGTHRFLTVPLDGPQMGEGHHLYKIAGKYYDVSAIPGGSVNQMVAKADSIDGPWKVTKMVDGESMGVPSGTPAKARSDDRGLWLHQGGIVSTPSGQWWSIIMSDHGSGGRMVSLVPITWDNDFPIIGLPGNLRRAPNTWIKPDTGFVQKPTPTFDHDDRFSKDALSPLWQWNHVPDDTKWSLIKDKGVLRLHSLPASDFYHARNSLCQRPPGPECTVTVKLDTSGLLVGDTSGLGLLSSPYAWIGMVKTSEGTTLQVVQGKYGGRPGRKPTQAEWKTTISGSVVQPPSQLWLRVHCNFDTDQAVFSWSSDGKAFTNLGDPFTMTFQLQTFQGVRPALFNFNQSGVAGGFADFKDFVVEEPRARGIEREIPNGKVITLTSSADSSVVVADPVAKTLKSVPLDQVESKHAQFKVIDLGLGRVALRTLNGHYVSAMGDKVILTDLGKAKPTESETFQWVNLMRGDTMLMSIRTHRYLFATPFSTAPLSATSPGPSPARKGGECFKWESSAAK